MVNAPTAGFGKRIRKFGGLSEKGSWISGRKSLVRDVELFMMAPFFIDSGLAVEVAGLEDWLTRD
jgi:hypothetical protein